jgi:hypothetical protein
MSATLYNQTFTIFFGEPDLPTGWHQVAGTADLVADKMRTLTTATTYASAGAYFDGITIPQNFDLYVNTTITTVTSTEFYGGISVRAASTSFNHIQQYSSWHVRFTGITNVGVGRLYRINAQGAETALTGDGADIDFVQGSVLYVHINCTDNVFSLSYWKDNPSGEPGSYMLSYTDATPPTGAMASCMIRNGSGASADDWRWDDFTITTPSGPGPGHRPGRRRTGG